MNALDIISNNIIRDDVQTLATLPLLHSLENGCTILVTGATGLIGSMIVRSLIQFSHISHKTLRVFALVRSIKKAQDVFGKLLDDGTLQLIVGDINYPLQLPNEIHYIIHGASTTSSAYFVQHPTQTIFTAIDGTRNILNLAKEKNVRKVVYLSSLEVYGIPCHNSMYITERDYGYIDPLQVRSSYSESKRMAECICASFFKEHGVPVTIARLSQTFGAGVSYHDQRVFAEFARCAIEKRDIVLHTNGNTVRNYCYISDAVSAIFHLMLLGAPGEAYNVSNMHSTISIRDMAQLVCDLFPSDNLRVKTDIPENIEQLGYNPEMFIQLDTYKLQQLGWKASIDLPDMFIRLINSMKFDSQIGV